MTGDELMHRRARKLFISGSARLMDIPVMGSHRSGPWEASAGRSVEVGDLV